MRSREHRLMDSAYTSIMLNLKHVFWWQLLHESCSNWFPVFACHLVKPGLTKHGVFGTQRFLKLGAFAKIPFENCKLPNSVKSPPKCFKALWADGYGAIEIPHFCRYKYYSRLRTITSSHTIFYYKCYKQTKANRPPYMKVQVKQWVHATHSSLCYLVYSMK